MNNPGVNATEPAATDDEPKPANPNHIRRDLHRLALDWIHLHTNLPQPARGATTRKPAYRESGHPAEWASDNAARIADLFASWHDALAEHRAETRPRRKRLGRTPDGCDIWQYADAEPARIRKAWRYLEPRIEQLCDIAPAEALAEIATLHHKIRRELGATNPKQVLPLPCPGTDCGLRTLIRRVAVKKDIIECGTCGYTVRDEYYPLLVRVALDAALDTAASAEYVQLSP